MIWSCKIKRIKDLQVLQLALVYTTLYQVKAAETIWGLIAALKALLWFYMSYLPRDTQTSQAELPHTDKFSAY